MKKLRFLLALWAAKLAIVGLNLLRRSATHYPGVIALKLCPDFLQRLPKPQTIIGVTGTNGKTTVSNLVSDILEDQGYKVLTNRKGGNILGGVTTALLRGVSPLGKCRYPLAVLELDERSSRLVLPHVQPDLLLCTNLFRDSFKRNAHPFYIQAMLKAAIPAKTRLILNGDDLLCCGIRRDQPFETFGVAPLPFEPPAQNNLIQDVSVCPACGQPLQYDFRRYHHVGRAHCPACGLASPPLGTEVVAVDRAAGQMTLRLGEEEALFPLPGDSLPDIYNAAAAVALLRAFGLSAAAIADSLSRCGIVKSRFNSRSIAGRQVILYLAKGQNPVACSRVFDAIRQAPGEKAVLLLLDDAFDAAHSSENTAWLYETDFEFLNDPSIRHLAVGGARREDVKVRLLLAGVPEERIATAPDERSAADRLNLAAERLYVLYDVYTVDKAERAAARLAERLQKEAVPREN